MRDVMYRDLMKKYVKKIGSFIRVFYMVAPFFMGIYCYYPVYSGQADRRYPMLDAIYDSLKLYSGSTASGVEIGWILQIARYLALAAMLRILVAVFNRTADVINRLKLCMTDSTVVYGDSEYAGYLYGSLPARQRIRGADKFIAGASRYLLMFSDDEENLAFFHAHYGRMKGAEVYIMLNGVSGMSIGNPQVIAFSIAENCARQYWRDYPVKADEKIAILGFGDIGSDLLLYGLQVNLIDPAQHMEYHIFGDGSEFRKEHTELDRMTPDEIVFHDGGVPDYGIMAEFDRIILCGDGSTDQNIRMLSVLLAAAPMRHPVYVYAPNGDIVSDLFGKERVICFGMAQEMASADMILNQRSIEAARRQHEDYVNRYGGVPWEKLDGFTRGSNISSADYMYVTDRLIREGIPAEKLAELEHIRWCRYHYLSNWKYAPETDKSRRLHNCLIPFADLSEEEKRKDIEAIAAKKDKTAQEDKKNGAE